jgi:hypothetical protein
MDRLRVFLMNVMAAQTTIKNPTAPKDATHDGMRRDIHFVVTKSVAPTVAAVAIANRKTARCSGETAFGAHARSDGVGLRGTPNGLARAGKTVNKY